MDIHPRQRGKPKGREPTARTAARTSRTHGGKGRDRRRGRNTPYYIAYTREKPSPCKPPGYRHNSAFRRDNSRD